MNPMCTVPVSPEEGVRSRTGVTDGGEPHAGVGIGSQYLGRVASVLNC